MCKRQGSHATISLRIPKRLFAVIKDVGAPIIRAEVASVNPHAHVCMNAVILTLLDEGLRIEAGQ